MREQSSEEDKQTVFCVIQTAAKNIASYTQSARVKLLKIKHNTSLDNYLSSLDLSAIK
jgi:hypothetical protein